MRFKDYADSYVDEAQPYVKALRGLVLERRLKYTGQDWQNRGFPIPVFSDMTTCSWTWRSWGDLMAAVWSDADNQNYSYMDFYM